MCRGLRHGYGVRKSAPYGDSQLNNPNKNGLHQFATAAGSSNQMLIHSNSLQSSQSIDLDDSSQPKPDDGFKPNIDRTLASKNGFVLVAKPLDVPMMGSSMLSSLTSSSSSHYRAAHDNISTNSGSRAGGASRSQSQAGGARRSSLTNKLASAARIPGSTQTVTLLRGLRLRKQKSTSDLDANYQSHNGKSNSNNNNNNNSPNVDIASLPFSLSPEELDITDPTTVETYTGEWKHDKRNGHGVCDRSDGLKYEGQWHNDTKHGYGVTTFKDGTKEEGKYKNNILITDSKVKRFFQLGGTNIRQRIDDAVKIANQAQAVSLKKAEIADTRAATARDKSDQATTAALEADRDSQIAYAVAKQYSDSHISMMQQPSMLDNFASQSQMNQTRPSFNNTMNSSDGGMMIQQQQPASAFHMRRGSNLPDFGRPQFGMNQYQSYNQNAMQGQQQDRLDLNQHQSANQQSHGRQQHYLGPVEPFNGRRGSFRGGSQSGDFGAPSTAFFSNQSQHQQQHPQQLQQHHVAFQKQRTLDPFNDLFDHYKSSNLAPASNFGRGRRPLSKQTSLDYARMSSVGPSSQHNNSHQQHHQYHNHDYDSGGDRLRRFRGTSLDRNDAEQQNFMRFGGQQSRSPTDFDASTHRDADASAAGGSSSASNMQQQFRHLVTSGEAHSQQVANGSPASQQSATRLDPARLQQRPHSSASSVFGQTPSPAETLSSYQRPPSSTAVGTSVSQQQHQPANSSYYPASVGSSALFPPGQMQPTFDGAQSQIGGYGAQRMTQQMLAMHHRDAQSLADEQYRYHHVNYHDHSPLDRTEYYNYDFAITTSPRQSQMPLRRTASLSRSSVLASSKLSLIDGKPIVGGQSATSRFASGNLNSIGDRRNRLTSTSQALKFSEGNSGKQAIGNTMDFSSQNANQNSFATSQAEPGTSGGPSSSLLCRKSSLQVRYNPADLGGLMSREEVAALSHAQREQKRLEAELAERRARRPFLHLYLNVKDFLSEKRLVLSVLLINMMLFKLFADLIT